MAADSYGPKGEPQFAGSGVPQDAADLSLVATWAAKVGNRISGTSAERAAPTGWVPTPGLEFYETDTGLTFVFVAAVGWMQRDATATIYNEPAQPTLLTTPGQTRTIDTVTLTAQAPQPVMIVATALTQVGSSGVNWAGNYWIAVNGVRAGVVLRIGNLNQSGNTPVPAIKIARAMLNAGSNKIELFTSIDAASGSGVYFNNPQIEVWPG